MERTVISDRQLRLLRFVAGHSPLGEELAVHKLTTIYSLIDRELLVLKRGRWYPSDKGNEVLSWFGSMRTDDLKVRREITNKHIQGMKARL